MNRWLLAAFLSLSALPAAPQDANTDAARASLLKADSDWAGLAATGKDVERIVAFWTDDAVIYPPGEAPIAGKAAIRKYVTDSLNTPGFAISWKPAQAVVATSGDLGYTTGTDSFTFPGPNKGQLITSHGRYVTTWRRTGTGPWRCVIDMWNEGPAATPAKK